MMNVSLVGQYIKIRATLNFIFSQYICFGTIHHVIELNYAFSELGVHLKN